MKKLPLLQQKLLQITSLNLSKFGELVEEPEETLEQQGLLELEVVLEIRETPVVVALEAMEQPEEAEAQDTEGQEVPEALVVLEERAEQVEQAV
jgi:hypothetical protein